ncbi:macro domain-containing protein [Agromyces humi]|uniref:macro domain-containing protein n=1 Tax=Agromyces humi TaxID=1766800 RepID=UPI001359FE5E|nr:macro domain-containing protein [Agromyces humi]
MTTVIHRTGDLFTSDAPAIGHGVNVDPGVMGSGIAVLFRDRFPGMHAAYKVLCGRKVFPVGTTMIWDGEPAGPIIYNIASQDKPGRNARIDWLESAVKAALIDADQRGLDRIALPRIGCGIGGLDWADVEPTLERLAGEHTADLEIWTL